MSAYRTYKVFFPGRDPLEIWRRANGYYDTTPRQKKFLATGYGILLVLAFTGLTVNSKYKRDPRELWQEKRKQNSLDGTEVNGRSMQDTKSMDEGRSDLSDWGISDWGISEWALQSLDSTEDMMEFNDEDVPRY